MKIDGIVIASQIEAEIKEAVDALQERKPCLAMVLVGEHPPSKIYVNRKKQACERAGILSLRLQLPEKTSETELINQIQNLNKDSSIDGILVQLPLPKHINTINIINSVDPNKDVDGLHPINAGKVLIGDPSGFAPCTPLGIKILLERSSIETAGRHAVILGRSTLVGKPMASLLMQNEPGANATVTVIHSFSKQVKELCLSADILIAAIGKPKFVTADMVKEGATVIDVGINKIGRTIVGDVDYETVQTKCSAITPVPGGVGPMTIAMLLSNTLKSLHQR